MHGNLLDGEPDGVCDVAAPRKGKPQYVQIELPGRSPHGRWHLTHGAAWAQAGSGEFQVSDDGRTFKTIHGLDVDNAVAHLSPVSAR